MAVATKVKPPKTRTAKKNLAIKATKQGIKFIRKPGSAKGMIHVGANAFDEDLYS